MLHVWQPNAQGKLRVWQPTTKTWVMVSGWQVLKDKYTDKTICLYVPTQAILNLTSELSTAQLKQLGSTGQQYLFEDISLTPVEQLRVRVLSNSIRSTHFLYAASTTDLTAWQQSAKLAELDVIALLPDYVLLPLPDIEQGALQGHKVSLYHDAETTLIRQSEEQGLAVSYLPVLLSTLPALQEVVLIPPVAGSDSKGDIDHQGSTKQQWRSTLDEHNVVVSIASTKISPVQAPQRHPLNFIEKQRHSKLSPYLRAAVLTAVTAGVLQMSADALQVYQYQQATANVQSAMDEQYSHWFEGESLNKRVTVAAQLQPHLATATTAESVQLNILGQVTPLIKQLAVKTKSLSWSDSSMTLQLISPEREGLDKLITMLTEQGINANLGRVEPQVDGGVVGEVQVNFKPMTNAKKASLKSVQAS